MCVYIQIYTYTHIHKAAEHADEQRETCERIVTFLHASHCPSYLIDTIRHWVYYTFTARKNEQERAAILVDVCVYLNIQNIYTYTYSARTSKSAPRSWWSSRATWPSACIYVCMYVYM